MAVLKNAETGNYEDIPEEKADAAIASGTHLVPLNDPEDNPITASADEARQLLGSGKGYSQPTSEQLDYLLKASKYQTTGETVKALAEAAGSAATLGQSTALERAAGVKPEDIRGRAEMLSPFPKFGAEVAGLAASEALGPFGAAKILGRAGEAASSGLGLGGEGATLLSNIGAGAAKLGTESAIMGAGDEASKMYMGDPEQTVASAFAHIGLSAFLGTGIGGGLGAASHAWEALSGNKTAQMLQALKEKIIGVEPTGPDEPPPPPSAITQLADMAQIHIAPELKSGMTENPGLVGAFQHLMESPTSAGRTVQDSLRSFNEEASNSLIDTLGKTPEQVSSLSDFSPFEAGKKISATLEKEIRATTDPLSQEFDDINSRYATAKVGASRKDKIGSKILEFALENKYNLPGTPQNALINKVIEKWLPTVQNLEDLKGIDTLVGQQTSGFQNQHMWHVGRGIKDVLREYEAKVVAQRLAEKEPELVGKYELASKVYGEEKRFLGQLDDRLKVGKFTGPKTFLKQLGEMAPEDVYRRLTQKNDAGLLNLLLERYPQTAEAVKQAHAENLLRIGSAKAKGTDINPKAIFGAMGGWSPELKRFVFSEEQLQRMSAIHELIGLVPEKMNNSGTAKTLASILSKWPSGIASMLSLATGHSPISGFLFGEMSRVLGTEIPDAAKLGILKMLGKDVPVNSGAFKSAIDLANAMVKGNNLVSKSAKAVFTSGAVVLPTQYEPNEKSRSKLEKRVDELRSNQGAMLDVGKDIGHYLPDHAASMASLAARSVEYLASIKPSKSKISPFDSDTVISDVEQDKYDRALDLAQQPLLALQSIKDGTLTNDDVSQIKQNPSVYSLMSQKLHEEMMDHMSKDGNIPYSTRLSLSLFLGEPLDSSMTQSFIAMVQPSPSAPNAAPTQNPKGKKSSAALSKAATLSQTPLQAREASRITNGA